jgi:phosphatidylglycerol lysyltransferase
MGRYSADHVLSQWVAVAYLGQDAVAFVSFFVTRHEWALDLMRQTGDAPDGTMHALVTEALEHAKSAGIERLSLAATPACPDPESAIWRAISMRVVEKAGGTGLRQFKSAFAPLWLPRYAAAPGPLSLAIGLADIARCVHHPAPLPAQYSNNAHESDENYEFESKRRA